MLTILEHIHFNAEKTPNTTAIQHKNIKLSFNELATIMENVVVQSRKQGLKPGDNMIFACKPTPYSLALALGLLQSGITLTIIDPFTSTELFENRAQKAEATHSVADPILYTLSKHRNLFSKLTKKQLTDFRGVTPEQFSLGSTKNLTNVKKWLTLPKVKEKPAIYPSPINKAVIVFTSGTTSEPKGVVHSLETLSANVEEFSEIFGITSGTRVYAEPMTLGLIALSKGGTWILPAGEKKFPECDVWFGTPKEILDGLKASQGQKIKTIGSGAAPVLPSMVKEIKKYHPESNIKCVYGMTEILPIAIGDAELKTEYLSEGDYIGKPMTTTEVKIVDNEILVKSPAQMTHYLGKEPEEYIFTGDYGKLLASGEIILTGRKKDMFIRGDMNVYPGLYEPGLSQIEGVKEVVVVGLADKYGDDKIIVVASPLPGVKSDELQKTITQNMVKYFDSKAVPDRVIVVPDLPKSGRANKIDRTAVVQLIEKM